MQAVAIAKLLRPKQWTKNLLIFAALIFTRGFRESDKLLLSALAFVAMCALSSAIYSVNDVIDADSDRNHPKKSKRPVASGAISPSAAITIAGILLVVGLSLSWYIGVWFLGGAAFYLLLQVAYNLRFKHKPLADVSIISAGFVLRAALGAVAINVQISGWLLLCTGCLALMLALAKRRQEFLQQGENRGESRKSLLGYTQSALDALVVFAACSAALSYGVYAIESPTAHQYPGLLLTVPFVLYGVMRYLFLVFSKGEGGEPENLIFGDRHLIGMVLGFVIMSLIAVSGVSIPFISGPVVTGAVK